jgi:hypothetical protein
MNTKRFVLAMAASAAAAASLSGAASAADLGFSLSIGQPDFYGRLDIGDYRPQLINRRPVVIQRAPRGVVQQPVYLRVPPGHERNWSRHCREYNACGQPVYFVRDDWYRTQYAPRYRESHHNDHDQDRRDDRRDGHDDRDGDHDRDHDRRD